MVTTLERSRIVELVRLFGGSTTDAVLDPSTKIFQLPGIDGFIGYRLTKSCAIVFGNPVCALENQPLLTHAFHAFAKQNKKNIIYVAVSQAFARWAVQHVCHSLVEFGEELVFDPVCDPREKSGTHASLVRRKVKQAFREGVEVHEYLGDNTEIEKAIEQVGASWLESRKGAQIHISNVYLMDDKSGKRWFYAKKNNEIVGVISQPITSTQWMAHQSFDDYPSSI